MVEIETTRLRLRRFTPNDLNDLLAIRADQDVMRYIGIGKPESLEQVQIHLDKIRLHWEQHGFGWWAVVPKDADKLIGWCGLVHLENTEDIEIGYAFAKRYWGNGFASEAGAAVIKYGFEALGLDRIVAIAWPENIVSRRVMDHLGMTYVKMHHHRAGEVAYHAISREEYLRKSSKQ